MGCDIHIVTEIKKDNKWIGIDEVPETLDERNYSTFAFLADVRNSFNTKGFKAKGYPDDISNEGAKELIEKWEDDGHTPSYLSLKELIEKDKSDYCTIKCKLVAEFYKKFIELGGIIPQGMEIEDEKPQGIVDTIRYTFEPTILAKWQPKKEVINKYPLFVGIEELKEIADKHNITNYENIRIVFCFDN